MRFKRTLLALLPVVALACALPVAAATAQGRSHHHRFGAFFHHGYWGQNTVVAGTITSVSSGSFGANAYVVTPGPGNTSTTPATTAVTLTTGSTTKVIVQGQNGLTVGDDFYAVYKGVPSGTALSTLATDTPAVVYAYAAPAAQVEVKGVITTAPAAGSDSFVATAYVVTPPTFKPGGGDDNWGGGMFGGDGGGDNWAGGGSSSQGSFGDAYTYGRGIGGMYGFTPASYQGHGGDVRTGHCLPGSTPVSQGTPNTTITTDANTTITINGQTSTVSQLAVGDRFTAVFNGTPNEPLSTIVSTPATSVTAYAAPPMTTGTTPTPAPFALYAFVGTVSGTPTSSSVTVNVTASIPSGLFSGTDTFSVSPQTLVLGNSGNSLANVASGDVVAGGLIGPSGETASQVESSPLMVLLDFPMATTTTSSTTSSTVSASIRRAHRRAEHRTEKKLLKLLRADRARLQHHHKNHK